MVAADVERSGSPKESDRIATGLERRGAGLLCGASGTGPAARAGEAGTEICLPSHLGWTVATSRLTTTAPARSG